jgi:type II secretory pathway component PulF
MPLYSFTALTPAGRERSGREEAISEAALESRLRKLGLWVAELSEVKPVLRSAAQLNRGCGPVSSRILVEFFLQLSLQLRAGIPLLTALTNETTESGSVPFRRAMTDLAERVQSGQCLSEAMAAHPRLFPKMAINVIRSGEASGKLSESCHQVRLYLEWQERMSADVRQALSYPCFILVCSLIFAVMVFTFVIPKFSKLLAELNVPLPGITQLVMGLSQFMVQHWLLLLISTFGLGVMCKLSIRFSPSVAYAADWMKMKTPILGKLYHMIGLSRFARNLSSIYQAGIPLIEALNLVRELVGNRVLERSIGELKRAVTEGKQMHTVMGANPVFSRLVSQMVAVGETTGSLGTALDNVASYYDEVLPRQIKRMFSVLEPLLILGLVGFVGCIALAVFLPIVSLITVR